MNEPFAHFERFSPEFLIGCKFSFLLCAASIKSFDRVASELLKEKLLIELGEVSSFNKMKNNPNKTQSKILLDFVSHRAVAWSFLKLCAAYKYVGLLV